MSVKIATFVVATSWPGVSGPPVAARGGGDGPDKPALALTGCGKTPCRIRPRFDFLRSEQARRERLSDARAGSSGRSPGRLCEPGGDGAAGSSAAADPPAGERGAGASVA